MSDRFRKVSRAVAQAEGNKRFYTGEPCMRGHDSERFVANGNCVECHQWKTPNKRKGARGHNTGWPPRSIVFQVAFSPLPEEIHAAFLYAEAVGWLNAALEAVHNDPALLASLAPTVSAEEEGRMHAELERKRRVQEARRLALETVTPDTHEPKG